LYVVGCIFHGRFEIPALYQEQEDRLEERRSNARPSSTITRRCYIQEFKTGRALFEETTIMFAGRERGTGFKRNTSITEL
jgi:hypothetical protein